MVWPDLGRLNRVCAVCENKLKHYLMPFDLFLKISWELEQLGTTVITALCSSVLFSPRLHTFTSANMDPSINPDNCCMAMAKYY